MKKPPANKLLALVLPISLYEALERLAQAGDMSIDECAERMLAMIVEDDAVAHGEREDCAA
jgi:hypothetical protein